MPQVRCLLWDFGDTLCDERFIWGAGPEWMAVYDTFDDGVGDRWCVNDLDSRAFAAAIAPKVGRTAAEVLAFMDERSRHHIEFFPFTYSFFRAHHLPQAIVTVNPDLWSETIVPAHRLDECCDTIVTSWEEGTIDKATLCALAVERIGGDTAAESALLIDNKQANIDAWEGAGGIGYLFTTDEQFARDVAGGLLGSLR